MQLIMMQSYLLYCMQSINFNFFILFVFIHFVLVLEVRKELEELEEDNSNMKHYILNFVPSNHLCSSLIF